MKTLTNNNNFFRLTTVVAIFAGMCFLTCKNPSSSEYGLDPNAFRVTVPGTPYSVSASATSSSSITVSWSAVSGATGYYVYRSTSSSGTYTHVGSSSTTSYTNIGLSSNTTYYYRVAAYNSAGTGSQSGMASARTQTSVTVPNAPTGVSASATSSSSITVTWNSVSGATGYYVYRSTSSNGTYTHIGSTTTTSFTNTGLSAGTTYYYRVAAYNSAGTGSSSTVYATTQYSTSSTCQTYVQYYRSTFQTAYDSYNQYGVSWSSYISEVNRSYGTNLPATNPSTWSDAVLSSFISRALGPGICP